MALICQKSVTVFAFEHREGMLHFEISIRRNMGQDQQYLVRLCKIPTNSNLPLGKVQLHIQSQKFCLTAHSPPKILLSWKIPELRRYGVVDGKFMFEGGSKCGKGSGVHGFESYQAEEINRNFQSSGRFPSRKQPLMWRRNKSQDVNNDSHTSGPQRILGNAEQDLRAQDNMRPKRHSVGVLDYHQAVEMVEKKRLMSIENVEKERVTRLFMYDIPPQLVRKVDSDPSIPEANEEFAQDDISNKNVSDTSPSSHNNMDKNKSNRNSGDASRSNRNSGDGTRSNRNSGDGTRSNRNSGEGTRSNRNSGEGTRSNRNSGEGTRSNRNSADGTRTQRNSGDGSRSNRNSGDGRRSKRNSIDGSRSNRNSGDSSHSSRSSGDGSQYHPRRFSGESGHSYWHSDVAHRSSLSLRRSLDNILAGNQNWVEDLDGEFKENALSRNNLYKSTSALCTRLSESDSVLIEYEVAQARSGSVLLVDEDVHTLSSVKDDTSEPSSRSIEDMVCDNQSDDVFLEDADDLVQPDMKDKILQTEITTCAKQEALSEDLNIKNNEAGQSSDNQQRIKIGDLDTHSGYVTMGMMGIKVIDMKPDSVPLTNIEGKASQPPAENAVEIENVNATLTDKEEKSLYSELDDFLNNVDLQTSLDSLTCSPESNICKGNSDLEELAQQEEILQHEMNLLDEVLPQVCVDEKIGAVPDDIDARKSQGFAEALSTLTIDTCWTEETCNTGVGSNGVFRHVDSRGGMLSPNLTSKMSRIPSCSKLVAPLPYVNLDKYDFGVNVSDHVDLDNSDNLMSASKSPKDEQSFRAKSLSCSDSSGASANLTPDVFTKRPPPPFPPKTVKEESPPPKLPPKGPNLLRRQKGTSTLFGFPGDDPQLTQKQARVGVVSRSVLSGETNVQYQSPRSVAARVSKPVPPVPQSDEPYITMSGFIPKSVYPSRPVFTCSLVEEVGEDDDKSAYMDMSAISLDVPPPALLKSASGPEIHRATKIPQVLRSQSVRTTAEASRKPKLLQSQSIDPALESHNDYVEMLCGKAIEKGKNYTDKSKVSMPFPNIFKDQGYRSNPNIELSVTRELSNNKDNSTLSNGGCGGKLDASNTSNKSLSFFTRFIQRIKSKDRKSSICSPDNTTDTKKSGSAARKNKADNSLLVPSVVGRSSSICYQNDTNLLAPPSGTDRKRSSSFPNETVFLESKQSEDENGKASCSKAKDKMDKRGSQSGDTLLALIEKEIHKKPEETYDSYWSMNPVEIICKSSCNEKKGTDRTNSEVEGGCTGEKTASEQTAEIAEFVAALPPFDPPKTKRHYSRGLSPVIEGLASTPRELRPLPSMSNSNDSKIDKCDDDSKGVCKEQLSNAASRKQRARETLRIEAPVEDKNGNIWIPRGPVKKSEPVSGHGVSGDDGMNTANRRNDTVNDVKEHLDALSLSSHGSSAGSPSGIRAEDMPLRSSPASTTLRPRSGKEYHRIDRRRLTDDHSPSSCPITPQSPSAGSMFTFDTPGSPSIRSILSRDGESPAGSPSIMRGTHQCHSYVNLGKGQDSRPNLYVNIDMTPPHSPFRRTHMPLKQIDPQLNYAEIDFSQAGSDRSRKTKKGEQKAATIEYAMIDMVATAAVSKTRKEQDTLRCSGRKFSAPASVIVKERRTLGEGSFREKDRARKLSTGKEYHRIDRRRLTDDHSPSSCPITPQSPSAGSMFTFDTPGSPSIRSILSRDGESPAGSPSIMRGTHQCHSYVNLGKGQDSRPNLYVNIDMTPPNSPFRRTHMPLKQIDPQLNYAEIDFSQAGSDRSRKTKKGEQKAATIEYAMIDMVATAAVSKTRKEQDTLRCSGRKFSAPASVIVKERRTLGEGSFREKDRARKLSTGKEYHRIDRRRLTDDHSPSSCPITPQSPSAGSMFTFDTPGSPSIRSILSRDGESPAGSPSIMRGTHQCHSYVNLGKGQDSRPNLYVNIDMTPPNSPFRRTHMPLKQIDPQLNYAEIDFSQAGSDRSRKTKKGEQKAATIEYAMIDMVATAAVSKTRKEQDTLRCSGRKFSAPASVIVKERRTLGGGSFREKDRARKLSTSSVDSNG